MQVANSWHNAVFPGDDPPPLGIAHQGLGIGDARAHLYARGLAHVRAGSRQLHDFLDDLRHEPRNLDLHTAERSVACPVKPRVLVRYLDAFIDGSIGY